MEWGEINPIIFGKDFLMQQTNVLSPCEDKP